VGEPLMSRLLLRAAAAAIVALLAGLSTAPSASADTREFTDPGGHINYVRVTHGPRGVGIHVNDGGISIHAYYHFWIDTNSTNPGPEYKAKVRPVTYPGTTHAQLMRVANFDSSGIKFRCEGLRAESDPGHQAYVKVIVPRSCISTPPKVRVAVVGRYDDNADGSIDFRDWAPGTERFYPWVNR
jgi:hypothetical protein